MKILLSSLPFAPDIGGIETVALILAEEWSALGHEVIVVTATSAPAGTDEHRAYRVLRQPRRAALLAATRWADVVFHNNISLKAAWPLLFARKPWVIAHHTWIPRRGAGLFKRAVLRFARNIAVSRAVAHDLPVAAVVIPNPYDSARFRPIAGIERHRDVVVVGRLVSDKGIVLALRALALLEAEGVSCTLSVIGEGPEQDALMAESERLGLGRAVRFLGALTGETLVEELHRHQLIAIPSLWQEPFGLVALEGMAAGCIPVAAQSGGLPEAVGAAGVMVERNNVSALAAAIRSLLHDPARRAALRQAAPLHLQAHTRDQVAARYLAVLESAATPHHRADAQRARGHDIARAADRNDSA